MYSARGKQHAINWVKSSFSPESVSPLAGDVIYIIAKIWGIHNFGNDNLRKTEWGNPHRVVIRYDSGLHTVDFNSLTALVVLCHDSMLRLSIKGRAKGYLDLVFFKRKSRDIEDGINDWCPTIEDHIGIIRGEK
jgi:hypothetical protein